MPPSRSYSGELIFNHGCCAHGLFPAVERHGKKGLRGIMISHGGRGSVEMGVTLLAKHPEAIHQEGSSFHVNIQRGDTPDAGSDLGLCDLIDATLIQPSQDSPAEGNILDQPAF